MLCCRAAVQVARDKLVSLGTSIGKLTHSGKFRLTVGALDVLSRYAKHKVSAVQQAARVVPQLAAAPWVVGGALCDGCVCVWLLGELCCVCLTWLDQGRQTPALDP